MSRRTARSVLWCVSVALLVALSTGVAVATPVSAPSLDEKIGQMLMVGFRGLALEDGDFIVDDIRRRHLGGVILFDYDLESAQYHRNIASPTQLQSLIRDLRQLAATPLLVAIDQEGGRVARLKPRYGFPATVSHSWLGQQNDIALTREHSSRLAATLAQLGIGLNMAPVVDLCSNPDNPVIARYERCFAADPQQVARHAAAYIDGHHQHGVLTCLKHFPGHGSSRADSHLGFTDITATWSADELKPYAELIASGQVDAVMTAHVFNARLDEHSPATLSTAIIHDLLRGQLGFDGVVISDDLQMAAIADHFGFETAIEQALMAGVDILLFGNNLQYDPQVVHRAVTVIKQLLASGRLSLERIDQSYRRIRQLKSRVGPYSHQQ